MSQVSSSQSATGLIPRRLRRKRKGNSRIQKEFQGQFGVTRHEVDVILTELCQQYECQWAIVSTVLYKEHKIRMNESRIKDRFTSFLDPKLKRENFTPQEEHKILKDFCVYGRRFKYFRQALPNRDRCMIKTMLETRIRQGLKKLEGYIWDEIINLPEQQMIGKGEVNKADLIRWLVSETKILWKDNEASFKLLYFFVVSKWDQLQRVPKDLAMLLYRRMAEIRNEVEESKASRLNKVDPSLYESLSAQQGRTRKKYRSQMMSSSSGHSESFSHQESSCKKEVNNLDISVRQLQLPEDYEFEAYPDIKIEEIEKELQIEGELASSQLEFNPFEFEDDYQFQ